MDTSKSVTVRLAEAADLVAVSVLMNQQNRYHADLVPHIVKRVEAAETKKWCAGILSDPAYKIFLALADGDEAVGLLMLHDKRYEPSVTLQGVSLAFVDELFVVPEARRAGIAKQLVKAGSAHAKSQGFAGLSLNVWGANRLAIDAYDALGFETVYQRMTLPTG